MQYGYLFFEFLIYCTSAKRECNKKKARKINTVLLEKPCDNQFIAFLSFITSQKHSTYLHSVRYLFARFICTLEESISSTINDNHAIINFKRAKLTKIFCLVSCSIFAYTLELQIKGWLELKYLICQK